MKQLELVDDGTIIIRTTLQEWRLRRPTLGELREIVTRAEAADKELATAVEAVEAIDGEPADARVERQIDLSSALQLGTAERPALFGSLVRWYCELLAEGEPPDVDDLPSWAVSGRASGRMIAHWRAVPLDLGPSAVGQ